jgi:hypothetical protein
MKIRLTIDLDERCRRAIAAHIGLKRPATHEECKSHLELAINGNMEDVCFDYGKAREEVA